ncbi:helix-turn-helix transcriptional regulator [Aquimarina sp. 2201CG14-23]|nr:helix-turn-helix transcriptional regulator [Aquimarina sp. 2201CG14-23]MDH7446876.1 helix-turn-helix transcriptional regulator [Aquimarina sp. 2201CG14-23]
MIDSEGDDRIKREKIIPDGYPEMIFHYEQPYRTNINGDWFEQEMDLIAGQIKNYFYLENTGNTGMFAIKFQPWALKCLFNLDMHTITDKVINIPKNILHSIKPVKNYAVTNTTFDQKVKQIENYLLDFTTSKNIQNSRGQKAVQLIIDQKGKVKLSDVYHQIEISERSFERYFKTHIGLTPKLYSRVIRFSNIFNLLNQEAINWADITYMAGFYDQSHFIKNFKEFTGEEPSAYGFTDENMANFFLKK